MTMADRIEGLLRGGMRIDELQVIDESHGHGGGRLHETHFKLILVSPDLVAMSRVRRHQHIYALLQGLLQEGVHALALHLYSPEEWAALRAVPDSPACRGGSRQSAGV